MLEDRDKLVRFADQLGLSISDDDTPTAIMTRALQLAESAENLPIP